MPVEPQNQQASVQPTLSERPSPRLSAPTAAAVNSQGFVAPGAALHATTNTPPPSFRPRRIARGSRLWKPRLVSWQSATMTIMTWRRRAGNQRKSGLWPMRGGESTMFVSWGSDFATHEGKMMNRLVKYSLVAMLVRRAGHDGRPGKSR